jgi:vacuolar-type H+-ATPase subunit I/STV1
MSMVVREFKSVGELVKFIDEEVNSYRALLAEFLRRLEDVRVRSEQEKKLRDLLKTLGVGETRKSTVIDLKDSKLIIDPSAEEESKVIEEAVERLNKNIQVLQSIRKTLEPLANLDIEAKITVILRDGIPASVLIKLGS